MMRHLFISAFYFIWVIIILASCSQSSAVRDAHTSPAQRESCSDGAAEASGKCLAQEKQEDEEKGILLPGHGSSPPTTPLSQSQLQENRAVVNPNTGEYLQPSGTGVYSPRTGDYYVPSGSSYFSPRTGEFVPRKP